MLKLSVFGVFFNYTCLVFSIIFFSLILGLPHISFSAFLFPFFFFMDFHRIAKRFHSYTTAAFCENLDTVWYSNVVLFVNTLELTADALFNTIIH